MCWWRLWAVCWLLNGIGGFTLGGLASFLSFNRSFTMPINQVSMQLNFIVMAMAGANRVFALLDEEPEVDNGYVTLVNAKEENGQIVESEKRTACGRGSISTRRTAPPTYVKLEGDVVFDGVGLRLHRRQDRAPRHQDVRDARAEDCLRRRHRSGKTTITNLINRFYDVSDGKIRYDGININKIKKSGSAAFSGHCAAGYPPVYGNRGGEYPLR